ncbi:MAG: EAL domain-containing protein, partial [Rudaea sp.]|nr:EAL domain-containing protein [Rudaea sp.]
DLLRNVQLASVMLDCDARITFCNEYLLHLTGWRLEQVVGRNWFELFIPAQAGDAKDSFARLLANVPDAWLRENEILTRSGGRRLMRWNNSVLRSGAGDVIGSASIGEDITEQKQAEGRIKQLNRVYAVLSGINTLIVRVSDRDELFREACRIAIDAGGFRVALISITDRSAKKIVPVASAARDENLLTEIKGILASAEDSPNTMIARAVGEKKAIVSNDSQRDPRVMSGRQYAESGICSMAVLPLMVSGDAVGTLALYAAETGFFGEEEMRLLTELTGDIAFAIDHIDKQDRLNYLAYYDSVTELPNRTLFHETLKKTLAQAAHGWLVAVMCIDVDFFKNVNDTLGHAIGDELLRQFGGRLVKSTRKRDTIGRLGGDEFALILLLQDAQEAVVLVNKIRDALREPFNLSDNHVTVTASIGITLHPDDASDPETLVKYADTAMYRAKQAGRDTFRFFTAQMNSEVMARLDLEAALRNAVANDEFVLYYQPKVELKTGRIAGLEALLRWERPGHGLVSPQAFIPALESTGLILQVGSWVIAAACRQIGLWTRSSIGPVQVSVNVSGRQFSEGDLHSDVVKALGDNEISGELLELELTESSLMANIGNTIASLQSLKKRGVQVSIDDFGTGYSSLAYLRRFPIDKLKIDIAFVRDVTSTPDDASIVQAIIRMAHSLKLLVIAEGVETPGQLAYLRSQGCDEIQGYYFSPPLPAMDVEKMLREQKRLPARDDEEREPVKTLLLVDDEARVLASLQRALRREGYHILVAQSAAEGFELLAQHPVHVILCDQRMPNMSGTVFLDRVKDLYPGTLRIVLSGYTDLESIIDAINRGAIYRFYTKPWNNKALRDNIREAFRHHQLLQAGSDKLDAAISPNRSSPPLQTGTVDQAS